VSVENGTTILFGLPGVAVDRVEVDDEGGRMVHLRSAITHSVIVVPGLEDDEIIVVNDVNKAMLLIDAPGPGAG
jgi:hypothetical protein